MSSELPKIIESSLYKLIKTTSGLVIIAKNSILEPTTLLIELPLIVTSLSLNPYAEDEVGKNYQEIITSRVLKLLEDKLEEEKEVFWNLSNKLCHLPKTVQDIMDPKDFKFLKAQGIIFSNNYSTNDGKKVIIYPTYSQFKHSCVPNTCTLYDKETNKLTIRTIRPIQKNQEITISRLNSVYTNKSSRQTELSLKGIICKCECCNLKEENLNLSDERRKKLKDLFVPLKESWMLGRCTGETFFVQMKEFFDDLEFENLNHVEDESRGYFFTTCLEVAASHREFAVASYCAKQVTEATRIRYGDSNPDMKFTALLYVEDPTLHPAWQLSNYNDIPFDPQGRGQTYKLYGIEKISNDGEIISTIKKKNKKNKKKKKKKLDSISTPLDGLESIIEGEGEGEEASFQTPPNEFNTKNSDSLNSSLTLSQSSTPDLLPSVELQAFDGSIVSGFNRSQSQSQHDIADSKHQTDDRKQFVRSSTSSKAETDLSTALRNVLGRLPSPTSTTNSIATKSIISTTKSPQAAVYSIAQKIAADVKIPSSHSSNASLSSTSTKFEDSINHNDEAQGDGSPKLDSDKSRLKIQKAEAKKAKKKREKMISKEEENFPEIENGDKVTKGEASTDKEVDRVISISLSSPSTIPTPFEGSPSDLPASSSSPTNPSSQNQSTNAILFSPGLPRSTVNSYFPSPTALISSEFLSTRTLTSTQLSSTPYVGPKSWKKLPGEDSLLPKSSKGEGWTLKSSMKSSTTSTTTISNDLLPASNSTPQPSSSTSTYTSNSSETLTSPIVMKVQSTINFPAPPLPTLIPESVSTDSSPPLNPIKVSGGWNVPPRDFKSITVPKDEPLPFTASTSTQKSTTSLEEQKVIEKNKFRKLDIAMGLADDDENGTLIKEPIVKGGWKKENKSGTGKFSSSSSTTSSSRSTSHFFPSSKNLGSNQWNLAEVNRSKKLYDSALPSQLPLPTFLLTPPTSPTSIIDYSTLPSISAYFPLPPKIPFNFDKNLNAIASLIPLHSENVQLILKENLDRVSKYPSHLPLESPWTLLFSDSNKDLPSHRKSDHYHLDQFQIFKASTVPELCTGLKSLALRLDSPIGPLEKLKNGASLAFFRDGIEPVWEDEWNKIGGRLLYFPSAKGTKSLDDIFLALVLLIAGESLSYNISSKMGRLREVGTIVGIVASKRSSGNRIEIWVAGSKAGENVPSEWLKVLRQVLSEELGLEGSEMFSYKKNAR